VTTVTFLAQLRARGIEIRADGDKLVINAPKGALTSELGDELRRRKADLLEFLQVGAASASGRSSARIAQAHLRERDDGAREAPLSFGQRRLFYLDQLEPGLAVYNVPVACWLSGALEVVALRGALDDVAARHAILRTTLRVGADGPVQYIAPTSAIDLSIVDLSAQLDGEERERRCRQVLAEAAATSFDLAVGPLYRAVLIRLAETSHVLLAATHHVVTDGWSQDIFERDLLAYYHARRSGTPCTLAPLDIQYADYAVWQISTAEDAERDRRISYWRTALPAPLPVLALPTVRPRPAMAPTVGETASAVVPGDLVAQLTAIGRRDGATLFMVLLAAYATLLYRITGQDLIIVGTPIANRNHAQTLDLIGYFANTLALRIDLSGAPTFRELLGRVRDVCIGGYANQDIPFEELVEKLEVTRDLSRSPVFQTIFAFEDALPAAPAPEGAAPASLRIDRRETIHANVARTDLSTWVSASSDGLRVTLEYPTALFDSEGMRDLLGQFGVLLRALASGEEATSARIDLLPLLSPEQRTRLVETWNATARPLPSVVGAHQLFEQQVDRSPGRPAVVFGDVVLTFRDLDDRANQLAHYLGSFGASPGAYIGVFLDRSEQMVISLLAALKVGATYVPLDPEYPGDRIALMIEDSRVGFIVTTESLIGRLPASPAVAAVRVIAVDRDRSVIASQPALRLPCGLSAGPGAGTGTSPSEHPCYAIYTSGSTGRPNGVLVPHRALINFLAAMAVRPGLDEEDTLLAVTTLSFDIAGLEMFLPLTVGAKLVIGGGEEVRDGRLLRALLDSSGATVMQATPATWRLLLAADWCGGDRFKALCGGEAFPSDLVAMLHERVGSVWNMYGPTETTIWSTCARLDRDDPRITIGRPIDNTSIYILDRHGQPVPVGTAGELVIGGFGVSLGYLQRPELTAARFVADPFRGGDALMYRTGDLAAWRADGQLVYHQRVDHQVKIRGYRIELGEIETVLSEHPTVERCAVLVREDRPGDARIVAYVGLRAGKVLTASDVRKHLRKRLPEFMIPQHVVELTAFPLTPAGKLDRKALPAPAGAVATPEARAPRTASEILVAQIWKDLLRTERVAATDNFFEIGGHSLLSMAVVARIQAETGARVSLRDLLLHSLEHIAQGIESGARP
jgi:amino acid adenylation domain-containing protein